MDVEIDQRKLMPISLLNSPDDKQIGLNGTGTRKWRVQLRNPQYGLC